ncbi:hypothetical protein DWX08_10690 [Ruminococcus sp. AF18-22]|nr:hypothetical protein DWX08_10690 [Ruminococcus sp. AF18-22]
MSWTPIAAFAVILVIFALGDIISLKTKGIISAMIVAIIVFSVFGGALQILPPDLIDVSGLGNILGTYGLALVFVNIGASLNTKELLSEWKTIVLVLFSMIGVVIMGFTVGSLIFGREYGLSSIAIICGGLPATLVTTEIANNYGRADIVAFVTTMMSVQNLVGIPIASFCLRKEAKRFTSSNEFHIDKVEKQSRFNIKFIPEMPKQYQTFSIYLCKMGLVALLAELVTNMTGLLNTISYLIMGFLFAEIGFLEKGSLKKAGAEGLVLLGSFVAVLASFLKFPFQDLLKMLVPIIGLLLLGAVACTVFAVILGKVLKWTPWLSAAVCITCMAGYPLNYALTQEAIRVATVEHSLDEKEEERLTKHLMPKMIIAAVVSVSITSAMIAAIVAPMIFK